MILCPVKQDHRAHHAVSDKYEPSTFERCRIDGGLLFFFVTINPISLSLLYLFFVLPALPI